MPVAASLWPIPGHRQSLANFWPSPISGHRQSLAGFNLWPSHITGSSTPRMIQLFIASTYSLVPPTSTALFVAPWIIIQLPHAFVGFTEPFDFSGYLAHHRQISPIYSTYDAGVSLNRRFEIVGLLAVPRDGNIVFYEVFEQEMGGADFLRAIEALYCQPNSLGRASDVWPLQVLADYFIQFCDAPFPNGFLPPLATIGAVPHPSQLPASPIHQDFSVHLSSVPPSVGPSWDADSCDAHNIAPSHSHDYSVVISTAVQQEEPTIFSHIPHLSQPNSVSYEYLSEYVPSNPPSAGPSWLEEMNHTSFMVSDYQDDDSFSYPPMTTSPRIEEPSIPSETNAIIIEQSPITSPINPTMVVHQALVWKGANSGLDKDHWMNIYRSLKKSNWDCPMLLTRSLYLGHFWVGLDNPFEFSEQLGRKLITDSFLAAIDLDETTLQDLIDKPLILKSSTGSSTVGWDTLRQTMFQDAQNRPGVHLKRHRILKDVREGAKSNVDRVRQGIIEIMELHMFREILFACLFQPIIGLAKDNQGGRIADLFPEEVQDQQGLRQGRKLSHAYDIIMSALTDMYDNQDLYPKFKEAVRALPFISAEHVFPMHPKELAPRTCAELGRAKHKDEVSATIIQIGDNSPGLPNSIFTSLRSQRPRREVDGSCIGPFKWEQGDPRLKG
ncbi:hypothetical protein F4604DRAFT_1682875 [Suillus subluteus]|nr:hypothetical protein F4604DRAFT_1682875 [Suillus subluteus]